MADVCRKKIAGCLACEYCHMQDDGVCVQKDVMQEVYARLGAADMLVIASPISYHGIQGQLKCSRLMAGKMVLPRNERNSGTLEHLSNRNRGNGEMIYKCI